MGVGEDVACLLIEHQDSLGLSDDALAHYVDWLEEMSMLDEDYVDLSFMDEEDDFPIKRGQQWEDSMTEEESGEEELSEDE